jgi:hypothetical protein
LWLPRVVLRAGEAQVVVEGLIKVLTCHFEDVVKAVSALAHVRLEEEGFMAFADGLIRTRAADAHVLGLAPLAATPRPGLGSAASSPQRTVPARRRAAVIKTD